ncbi:MAG: hypothetical protein MUC49_11560 [Raineya sp.]|jgi:hypothetical protein|nr:hypothetical protein [Raineya sp.]
MKDFFSPFVFVFAIIGVSSLLIISLGSWFLVAKKMKVDILKIGIAYSNIIRKRYLWKIQIKKTDYFLGYIPIVPCFMELKGSRQEEYEILPEDEKQYAFLHKSELQQKILNFLPAMSNILLAIIYSFFANVSGEVILNSIAVVLKMMCGIISIEDFKTFVHQVPQDVALIPFIWAILYGTGSVLHIIAQIPFHQKIRVVFSSIMGIVMIYFIIYLIPSLLISFFSYSQILKFILSSLLGSYLVCIIIFFVLIGIVKLNMKNE